MALVPPIPSGLPNFNNPIEAARAWASKVEELNAFKNAYGRGDEFYSVNCLLHEKNAYDFRTDNKTASKVGTYLTKLAKDLGFPTRYTKLGYYNHALKLYPHGLILKFIEACNANPNKYRSIFKRGHTFGHTAE